MNWSRDDIARVSVNEDDVARIIQENDANESSSDSETDYDSDDLVCSDDDSIPGIFPLICFNHV